MLCWDASCRYSWHYFYKTSLVFSECGSYFGCMRMTRTDKNKQPAEKIKNQPTTQPTTMFIWLLLLLNCRTSSSNTLLRTADFQAQRFLAMAEQYFEDEQNHDDMPLGAEASPPISTGAVTDEEGQEEPGPGLETCKVCKTCDEDLPLSCYACQERTGWTGG